MTATRWQLEDMGHGRLGLRNANDARAVTYALCRIDGSSTPKLRGKTDVPSFWQLERRTEACLKPPPVVSYSAACLGQTAPAIVETTDAWYADVYDSGGFRLGRFKLADSFMENLNGGHRRTSSQVHGGAYTASGGSTGAFTFQGAPLSFTGGFSGTSPQPKPIENAGIRAGEIVGYRCWRVVEGFLHSTYVRETRWPPMQPLRAVGMTDHMNGVHALKDEGAAQHVAMKYVVFDSLGPFWVDSKPPTSSFVTGTCFLWGDVVEHEKGWRGSFATVKSIDAVVSGDVDLEALRGRYGCA